MLRMPGLGVTGFRLMGVQGGLAEACGYRKHRRRRDEAWLGSHFVWRCEVAGDARVRTCGSQNGSTCNHRASIHVARTSGTSCGILKKTFTSKVNAHIQALYVHTVDSS